MSKMFCRSLSLLCSLSKMFSVIVMQREAHITTSFTKLCSTIINFEKYVNFAIMACPKIVQGNKCCRPKSESDLDFFGDQNFLDCDLHLC